MLAPPMSVIMGGLYTYGQPVRGSFEARITVKSTGWNFRERRTITRREDDTGPSGCSEFPIDLGRLELNSTDFSLWNARLSVDVDYTETSTGVVLQANSESAQITRDALKLQFDSPNIFKPGVPYYGKIFVTHPDGSPAAGKLISLSCNTDQGQIFDKNLTSPENGAIEFTVTDINITSTSLNLYAHAPGFNIPPPETYGPGNTSTPYTTGHLPLCSTTVLPSGSFLQIAPIRGVAAVGGTDPQDRLHC
nr:alpha-2-macroglobulin-like [Lytechinus pictus]